MHVGDFQTRTVHVGSKHEVCNLALSDIRPIRGYRMVGTFTKLF